MIARRLRGQKGRFMNNKQIAQALRYCNGLNCEGCPLYEEYARKGGCNIQNDAAGRIEQLERKTEKQKRIIAAMRKERAKESEA